MDKKYEKFDKYDKNDRYDRYDRDDDFGGSEGREDKKGRKLLGGANGRKKPCRFCNETPVIDYKNPKALQAFMTEHGAIVPRRVSGNCAYAQRQITQEIKRARVLGLVGFTGYGPQY